MRKLHEQNCDSCNSEGGGKDDKVSVQTAWSLRRPSRNKVAHARLRAGVLGLAAGTLEITCFRSTVNGKT